MILLIKVSAQIYYPNEALRDLYLLFTGPEKVLLLPLRLFFTMLTMSTMAKMMTRKRARKRNKFSCESKNSLD